MSRMMLCLVVAAVLVFQTSVLAALASQSTGTAVTSANLSTNPTIRKQQLLVDPAVEGDPLTLSFAKLDVQIHLDTPIGVPNAQDIINSIFVTPNTHFLPFGTMPYYDRFGVPSRGGSGASFNVFFDGRDILIKDFAVMADPENPPAPGEVVHALVDVQYNDLLPFDIYKNILATYVVTTNPESEIRAKNSSGTEFSFVPPNIAPATDSETLGVPEPGTMALLLLGAAALRRRSR